MSLSELVSALGLHLWAEIALVMFVALFAGVLIYAFGRKRAALFDRARRMPLDEA
jgi:cbb3-type cytochrome oxidase subunit 3